MTSILVSGRACWAISAEARATLYVALMVDSTVRQSTLSAVAAPAVKASIKLAGLGAEVTGRFSH